MSDSGACSSTTSGQPDRGCGQPLRNHLKPKRPYLGMKQDDEKGLAETVFQTLCGEPYIYLLPEYEHASSQQKVVEEFWPEFEALE